MKITFNRVDLRGRVSAALWIATCVGIELGRYAEDYELGARFSLSHRDGDPTPRWYVFLAAFVAIALFLAVTTRLVIGKRRVD